MKPADLKPGHRIATDGMGVLTVVADPNVQVGPEVAAKYGIAYDPALDRVLIDIEPDHTAWTSGWDVEKLTAAAGADRFQLLTINPLRYRLSYLPDADVRVEP